jgi:type IV pilus assembly protein PilV
MKRRGRKARGFTLVEVLISVFVLSIGLLGLAGLQVTGLQNNHSAYLRSQATILAYDMAERMRANPVGLANGLYDDPNGTMSHTGGCTTACTPVEMAGHDLYELSNAASPLSVGRLLPGGSIIVCRDDNPEFDSATAIDCENNASNYAIYVNWTDDRTGVLKRFVTTVGFGV